MVSLVRQSMRDSSVRNSRWHSSVMRSISGLGGSAFRPKWLPMAAATITINAKQRIRCAHLDSLEPLEIGDRATCVCRLRVNEPNAHVFDIA